MHSALVSTRLKHKTNKKSPYSATNRIGAMIHTLEAYTKEHYYYTTKPSKAYLIYPNLGLGGYFYGKKESRWTIPGIENHQR